MTMWRLLCAPWRPYRFLLDAKVSVAESEATR
jgi:hypothetical protein